MKRNGFTFFNAKYLTLQGQNIKKEKSNNKCEENETDRVMYGSWFNTS